MSSTNKIKEDIAQLASFYDIDNTDFLKTLSENSLESYVELVIAEKNFEVVLGGMNKENELIRLAKANNFQPEIIDAFEKCIGRFPNKMLYTKFCMGSTDDSGSMYLVIIEPFDEIIAFLASLSFSENSLTALKNAVSGIEICFLLGFTFHKKTNQLLVKTYHLFDRSTSQEASKPFLISHRLSATDFSNQTKSYTAKVDWQLPNPTNRWKEITDFGQKTFANNYAMLRGEGSDDKIKFYIFRFDVRENEFYSLKTYNYYVEEGNRLIDLNKNAEALHAFQNAIDYDSTDAEAYNRLGFCTMMEGKYVDGIKLVLKAKAMNPNVSNVIWNWTRPIANHALEIANVSQEIEKNPTAELYNTRGILYFHERDYQKAKEDLLKAVELSSLYAEAYNNLGGTYIKLGEFVEAVKVCTVALSINRNTSASNLSIANDAIRIEREATNNPSEATYNALGKFYYQLDLFEEASQNFIKATEFV